MSRELVIPCKSCIWIRKCQFIVSYLTMVGGIRDLVREVESDIPPCFDIEFKCHNYECDHERTFGEIIDTMTTEQKKALYALVGYAMEGDWLGKVK